MCTSTAFTGHPEPPSVREAGRSGAVTMMDEALLCPGNARSASIPVTGGYPELLRELADARDLVSERALTSRRESVPIRTRSRIRISEGDDELEGGGVLPGLRARVERLFA